MNTQKLLVIAGNQLRHQYFVNQLNSHFPLSAVFTEHFEHPKISFKDHDEENTWNSFFIGRQKTEEDFLRCSNRLATKNKPKYFKIEKGQLNQDDTIKAMILAGIQRGKLVSGVYNIGTGHSTSLRQMIRNIKSAGVAVNVSYSQKVSTGKNSFSLDASRFRKYFGWKAKTLPSVGIKKTILWFQKNTSL